MRRPWGSIVFIPVEGTPGPSRGCTLDDKGRYDLPAKDGLLAKGTYRVEVVHLRPTNEYVRNTIKPGGPPIQVSKNYIPRVYNHKSILKVTVSESSSANQLDFKLKKPSPPTGG
jgi:hypothetical protein